MTYKTCLIALLVASVPACTIVEADDTGTGGGAAGGGGGGGGGLEPCETIVTARVTEPTTWSCETVRIERGILVEAPLQIEPGVTVRFEQGTDLTIQPGASLNAVGTADAPIELVGDQATKGFWSGLTFLSASPDNRLEHVRIRHTGAEGYQFGTHALYVGGDATTAAFLALQDVDIAEASGLGLASTSGGVIESAGVSYANIDDFPIEVASNQLHLIDAASSFGDGLGKPWIRARRSSMETSETWLAHEIPYRFEGDRHRIENGDAVITVEAGARLEFEQDASFEVYEGGLSAVGSSDAPIVFTGLEPVKGYWAGIIFLSASASNELDYAQISYAGDESGYQFQEYCVGAFQDANLTVTNSYFGFCANTAILAHEDASLTFGNNSFEGNDAELTTW